MFVNHPVNVEKTDDSEFESREFKNNQKNHFFKGQTLAYGFTRSSNAKAAALLGFKDVKACLTWVDTQRKLTLFSLSK